MIKSRTLAFGLKESYTKNFLIYMMVLLFLLSGFLIGVYLFTYLDSETVTYLKNDFIEYMEIIKNGGFSLVTNLKVTFFTVTIPMVIFILFSVSIVFSPITLVTLALKGFTLGFSITFMLTNFSFKGVPLALFTIIIPNTLVIFLYILLCVKSISVSLSRTKLNGRISSNDWSITFKFLFLFIIASILVSLLFQCLITPFIIKLIF